MRITKLDIVRIAILAAILIALSGGNISGITKLGNEFLFATIAAIGLTMIMATGAMDLSIPSAIGLSSVVFALCLQITENIHISLAIALIPPALFSLLNGMIAYESRFPVLLVTIITSLIFSTFMSEAIIILTQQRPILLSAQEYPIFALRGLAVAIVISLLFLNRKSYLIRQQKQRLRLKDIYLRTEVYGIYFLCGLLFATVGILTSMRLNATGLFIGMFYGLHALTIAMIGGASLRGGGVIL